MFDENGRYLNLLLIEARTIALGGKPLCRYEEQYNPERFARGVVFNVMNRCGLWRARYFAPHYSRQLKLEVVDLIVDQVRRLLVGQESDGAVIEKFHHLLLESLE